MIMTYFSRRRYSFEETQVDNDPSKNQAQDNLPANATHIRDTVGYLKNLKAE